MLYWHAVMVTRFICMQSCSWSPVLQGLRLLGQLLELEQKVLEQEQLVQEQVRLPQALQVQEQLQLEQLEQQQQARRLGSC